MKMKIGWHEENLRNQLNYVKREEAHVANIQNQLLRLSRQVSFAKAQLETAKKKKLDGFDSERFLKSKRSDFGID